MRRPPARWLRVAGLWIAFCVLSHLHAKNDVWELSLPDNDDYVRMVQARSLAFERGWFDSRESRLDPPRGVEMHWSRLPDVPIAAALLGASIAVDDDTATALAAALVPAIYALLFLLVVLWTGRGTLGEREQRLSMWWAALAALALGAFHPGRVDHHGLQIVLLWAFVACLVRWSAAPGRARLAALAGAIPPVSAWVGLETLPFVAVGYLLVVAGYMLLDDVERRGLVAFALATAVSALVTYALATPPDELGSSSVCDAYSRGHLVFFLLASVVILGLGILAPGLRTQRTRLLASLALGLPAAAAAIAFLGDCLHGPYSSLSPLTRELWLDHVTEAQGLASALREQPLRFGALVATPMLALVAGGFAFTGRNQRERAALAVIVAMLATALAVSVWQVRGLKFATALSVIPLAILAARAVTGLMSRQGRLRAPAVAAALLFLNPLGFDIAASLLPERSSGDTSGSVRSCEIPALLRLKHSRPLRLLAFNDLGPELLFRTDHHMVGAPYHRNDSGIADVIAFFTGDEQRARAIAQRRKIDLVVLCPGMPEDRLYSRYSESGMIHRLSARQPPDWLEPVPTDRGGGMIVYRSLIDAVPSPVRE